MKVDGIVKSIKTVILNEVRMKNLLRPTHQSDSFPTRRDKLLRMTRIITFYEAVKVFIKKFAIWQVNKSG